jgi:hypothetical protein
MTPERPPRFDDPVLKSAVRRAWGDEQAPPELRQRIETLLAAEQAAAGAVVNPVAGTGDDVIHVPASLWRRKGVGLAAAAAVVLGVSVAASRLLSPDGSLSPTGVAGAATSLPADLAQQLVKSHDRCLRFHPDDHHLFTDAPKDDFKAIAAGLSAELNHPVVATAVGDDWAFRGAAVCPVGQTKSAHLMYGRGDAAVSVFSLPASAVPGCGNHQCCDAAINGHPVAGFVESGAFYAVVASSGGKTPVDLEQIRAMRDQIRGDVVAMSHIERVRIAYARP